MGVGLGTETTGVPEFQIDLPLFFTQVNFFPAKNICLPRGLQLPLGLPAAVAENNVGPSRRTMTIMTASPPRTRTLLL